MTTVIITRPISKQKEALKIFSSQGFDVFSAPCFTAMPNHNFQKEWLKSAINCDVLVILNSHAIDAMLHHDKTFNVSETTQVIGIGDAVAAYWRAHFESPITQAQGHSESVIAHLEHLKPQNLTVLTTQGGRELIKAYALKQAINFKQLNCYTKQAIKLNIKTWQGLLKGNEDLILTANSGQILHYIKSQLPEHLWHILLGVRLICGSERISTLAAQLGFINVNTAPSPSNHDILSTLVHKKSVG